MRLGFRRVLGFLFDSQKLPFVGHVADGLDARLVGRNPLDVLYRVHSVLPLAFD